jgi:hypothetical protein
MVQNGLVPFAGGLAASSRLGRRWAYQNVRCIEVVLTRDTHQREQGITPGIG